MYIENPYDKTGEKSGYMPPQEVLDLTSIVQRDYATGHGILTRTWIELNQRSILDDENRGQLMFNAFVDTSIEDPAEAWKYRGTRSQARNKGIAMHANLTQKFILPSYVAQNDESEVDQTFSEVMRDLIEWMIQPNNSDYQNAFMQVVFGMMTSPVTYLGAEFCEIYQKVKDTNEKGEIIQKDILDKVLSGFRAPIFGPSEVLITNAYERNIQRQRAIIERQFVDKEELEAEYGKHPNWSFVKAGWRTVYNAKDNLFYNYYDIQHPLLVEKVVWKNRREDTEVVFLGGIYMGADDVSHNPMRHRDNRGAPKYNKIPFGYSRIGTHFFYFKSMMNVLGWDNMLYDAMTEITVNRAILEADPPYAISGSDKVDSEIIFPKAVVAFEDKDTKVTPLLPPANLAAGYKTLLDTSQSMSEESIDPISSGILPPGRQQAYVIATVQANAKKIVREVMQSLSQSMVQYGDLMKDIAINHITLPEVEELVGGGLGLKYRSFLLPNKQSNGINAHKKIVFDRTLIGMSLTPDEKDNEELAMLEEIGWPDNKQMLVRVNPQLFAKFEYLSTIDVEEMTVKNNEYWQPILTNLYGLLRQDPFVDAEGLLRRLMRAYFNSDGESLVRKQPVTPPGTPPAGVEGTEQPPQGNTEVGRKAQSSALSTVLPLTPQR